ncbi:AAA family ATPase [Lentzea sp. NPDC004789]
MAVESGRARDTRLPLGRRAQVELVRSRVREAAAGRPGLLVVRGADGIGKSALLAAVCEDLRGEAEVLSGVCGAERAPYSVVRSLFGGAADEVLAAEHDEHGRRRRLLKLAAARAGALPLVVVIDDADRCDGATARWLGLLARRARAGRLFFVLAHRVADRMAADVVFGELAGALDTTVIELGPLGAPDVRELIRRRFGAEPHEEFLRACLELCNGVPGTTLACLARIAEEGGRPGEQWAGRLREVSVASWSSWFGQQAEQVLRYATAVAVIGTDGPDATGALFELSAAAVSSARGTLRLSGVLTEHGTLRSESLRAHLLDTLEPEELAGLRLRAARLLSDEGKPRREVADQLAALPVVSEPWMAAILREAARECGGAPEAAVRYLRRAVEAVPGHIGMRLEQANLLYEVDPVAAGKVYAEVLRDISDAEERAFAAARYGAASLRTSQVTEAFRDLVGEWRALPATADPEVRAVVEVLVLMVGLGGVATTADALCHAREMVPPTEARSRFARRLVQQLGRAEMWRGESVGRTLALTRSSLPQPGTVHDWWDTWAAASLHFCGELPEAAAVTGRVLASAAERGDESSHVVTHAHLAHLRLDLGELADAAAHAEEAMAYPLGGEHTAAGRRARAMLATVCARNADDERANALLEVLPHMREPQVHLQASMVRALLLRNSGQPEAALDRLRQCGEDLGAMDIRNPLFLPWWLDAVALLAELGRLDEAAELASFGEAGAARWNTAPAQAHAALARGLATGDATTLEDAARRLEAAGYRLRQAEALTALGLALSRAGDDKGARRHLRRAVGVAVRCGATGAAAVARAALVRAGGRMSELSTKDVLTGGERRVAELAALGLTNRQIADDLFVAVRTVESHLSNAYRKLGVQTRADLAARLR